jgi:hypothetical protein
LLGRYDMSPCARQSRSLLLSFLVVRLTGVSHEYMEAMPQLGDGVVFLGHTQDFLEFTIQYIALR